MKIVSLVGNSSMCGANYVHYCLMDKEWDVISLKGKDEVFFEKKIKNLSLSYFKVIWSVFFGGVNFEVLLKYDIILADGIFSYLIAKKFNKKFGKKVFALVHNDFRVNNRMHWGFIPNWLFTYIYQIAISDMDIVTTSNSAKIALEGEGNSVTAINNGVNVPIRHDSEVGFQSRDFISIWYIGRVIPIKRVLDIAKALSLTEEENFIFEIVGDGTDVDVLIECCEKLAVKYIYHGYSNHPFKHVHQGDIFILPSEVEGRSIALMEALISGCYCIVSDIEPNLEFKPYNCHFFPVGDVCSLSSEISKALSLDNSVRFNIESMLSAKNDFSVSAMKMKYLELFQGEL